MKKMDKIVLGMVVGLMSILTACGPTGTGTTTGTTTGTPLSAEKAITAFGIVSPPVAGVINGTNIVVGIPSGSSVTALVAAFSNTGVSVKIGSVEQVSGITTNDFTNPVIYTVTAADGSAQNYYVQVVPGKAITSFSLDAGALWTARDSSRNWRCVVSSADGTKLFASVWGGQLYTSTDSGLSWTPQNSAKMWYDIASSADGTTLVAVENSGYINISTDSGATWKLRGIDKAWMGVVLSADGTKMVAGVNLGQIYTSINTGTNWTPRDSARDWRSVASSSDGTKLAAIVYGGQIFTSTDSGVTWTARESSRYWCDIASSADGTKLVAAVYNGQNIYFNQFRSDMDGARNKQGSGVQWQHRRTGQNSLLLTIPRVRYILQRILE